MRAISPFGLLVGLCLFGLTYLPHVSAQTREAQIDSIREALQAKEFERVIELTRTALRSSPSDAQLWIFQGIGLVSSGKRQEALNAFKQALKFSPNNPAALAGAA